MDIKKIMGWVIIVLMSFSVLGFIGGSYFADDSINGLSKDYNGFTLFDRGNTWQLQSGGIWYSFNYFPDELEEFELSVSVGNWLNAEKIYIGYNPENNVSFNGNLQQISSVLYVNKVIPQQSCTNDRGCPDIPLINCQNNLGIVLLYDEYTSFSQREKCVELRAKDTLEMQKLTERLIYKLLGVMY